MSGPGPGRADARRLVTITAAAIVLVAAALRCAWPTQVDWDSDTALHYLRAAELGRGERLDLLAGYRTHAGGARLSPLFHYVLAVPSLLGGGPIASVLWVGLADLAVVLLLIGPGRRVWGQRVALGAAALYAALAAVVLRARALHNETLLAPLAVALLLALAYARRRPASRAAGWGLAVVGIMPQLHLSSLFLLPGAGAALLPRLRRAGLRAALPGLALVGVAAAPYLVHETRGGFAETRALLRGAGGADQPGEKETVHARGAERLTLGPRALAGLLGTSDVGWLLGPTLEPRVRRGLLALLRGAASLSAWLLPLAAGAGLLLGLSGRLGRELRLVAILVLSTLLTFAALGVRAGTPYVVQLLPLLCLLAAGACLAAWRAAPQAPSLRAALRVALTAACGVALAGQAALAGAGVAAVARAGGAPDRPFRLTYGVTRAAADWLLERELALARFPAWQHCLMLDVAWRELPPARAGRFQPRREVLRYWDLPYLIPVPRGPLRTVSLVEVGPDDPPPAGALARFGALVVVEEPGQ